MSDAHERVWLYHFSEQYEDPTTYEQPTSGADYTEYRRADLPPTRAQVEAMVRPLVWDGFVSGPYEITVKDNGSADLLSHAVHDEDWNPDYIWGGYLTLISIDDLKAAAQADYTARILSALNLGDDT